LKDSSLIARKLADNPLVLCASPSYLAHAGSPSAVADLAEHQSLVLNGSDVWIFGPEPKSHQVRVTGRFTTNSIEAIREACVAGQGLALLSLWKVRAELETGQLKAIDFGEDHRPQALTVWAIFPSAKLMSIKSRIFVDTMTEATSSSRT
jgi:DNA-binding transcriptional LysR family regulator